MTDPTIIHLSHNRMDIHAWADESDNSVCLSLHASGFHGSAWMTPEEGRELIAALTDAVEAAEGLKVVA